VSLQERQRILQELESSLDSPVLAFVTGDRPALATQIAAEQLVYFPRHVEAIGKQRRLSLLLYTRGGETQAAWPIVNFIREYCDELFILVPFYAHSAGTLMALGANRILMARFATLSPIDPTVANPFNPQDPVNPQNRIPIAVEDVLAFFELSKRQGAEEEEHVAAAFKRLAEAVHPLALGNVQRSIDQIRQLAQKMIRLHSPDRPDEEVEELVRQLTTALYSHFHLISRREAKEIGLAVDDPEPPLEDLLLAYYEELKEDLKLLERFDPAAILRGAGAGGIPATPSQTSPQPPQPGTTLPTPAPQPASSVPIVLERAYIETKATTDAYVTRGSIGLQPAQMPPGMVPAGPMPLVPTLEIASEGWERVQ
jgi:Serine dehydrogenase proteinase